MQRVKFLLVLSIVVLFLSFYGNRLTSPNVTGAVTGSPAAPTGVAASNGDYANKVGINWETIRGATVYRIFRNTVSDTGTATDVGTTSANYFFDSTAIVSITYFYWVRAENGGSQSSFSASTQGFRAASTGGGGAFLPLNPPLSPPGNPVTATKAYLGKALFWDEQLSSTRTVSCGTCHRPGAGGADPRSTGTNAASVNPGADGIPNTPDDVVGSIGVPSNNANGTYNFSAVFGQNEQVTGRVAPSYLNAAYSTDGLFWDGRASFEFRDPLTNGVVLSTGASLESQSVGPPLSDVEMAHAGRDWTQAAAGIAGSKPLALATNIPSGLASWIDGRTYPELFLEAFGTAEVTPARIAMAIATHERTLFSDRTPLDRASAGIAPLQPNEEQGRQIFIQSSCNSCHSESLLSDQLFHNIGVRPQDEDQGRWGVTNDDIDRGSFKTPTLRNVSLRPSFMHNGRFHTLASVINFYDIGGHFPGANTDMSVIRPLNLDQQEKNALNAFMTRPLTDLRVTNELPPFDRPTLYTETARVPAISGSGRPGTGGQVPTVKAVEPPLAGNPSFTVGVSNVAPATQAVLVINSTDPGVGTTIPATGSFTRQTIQTLNDGSNRGYSSVSLAIPATPAVIGQTFFGRWYVTDGGAANGFSVSRLFQFTVFGSAAPTSNTRFDFDGDGKSDLSIFRPSVGQWWYLRSSDFGNRGFAFGLATDKLAPADYTGDGKTDIALFRNGEWFVLRSEDNSFYSVPFGTSGDIPAPGDFDGDGKADTAVYRQSDRFWYIQKSSGGTTFQQFGVTEDRPVVEDYDGDGKDDIAVFRPSVSQWWLLRSTAGVIGYQFGSTGDKTVQGDFTGDGKADVALFRPSNSNWYILRSENSSFYSVPFGASGDIPTAGDYDGDGKTDTAVFRPTDNFWYVQGSTSGFFQILFGTNGDTPVPAVYNAP